MNLFQYLTDQNVEDVDAMFALLQWVERLWNTKNHGFEKDDPASHITLDTLRDRSFQSLVLEHANDHGVDVVDIERLFESLL